MFVLKIDILLGPPVLECRLFRLDIADRKKELLKNYSKSKMMNVILISSLPVSLEFRNIEIHFLKF